MQIRWSSAAKRGHNAIVNFCQLGRPRLLPSANSRCSIRTSPQASMISSHATGKRHTHQAAVAFGSNLGNRIDYIEAALREMREAGLRISRVSPIYETKPMYYEDQDTFLNGVCQIETEKEPLHLLDTLQGIETKLDRKRDIQKGPRTIDLDIILYDQSVIETPRLEVPHKLLHEREFVLRPLNDIMPQAIIHRAQTKMQVSEIYQSLKARDESMSPITALSPHLPLIRSSDPSRRTTTMAILNLTPDSFSDGGIHNSHTPTTIQQSVTSFLTSGATIIDIGGQSTRPHADLLNPETELSRILPAIHTIRSSPSLHNTTISIDTFHARVAASAIAAGADIINDISAGQLDPEMLPTVAKLGKTIILMHMRGNPQTMTKLTHYPNGVVNDVLSELSQRVSAAEEAGIPRWRIVLDPGIGFAKTQEQNLELLRNLSKMREAAEYENLRGLPWLVGTSRKGFVGKITGVKEAGKRVMGTAAAVTASVAGGADVVRVHDVGEMVEVVKMADAIYRGSSVGDGEKS